MYGSVTNYVCFASYGIHNSVTRLCVVHLTIYISIRKLCFIYPMLHSLVTNFVYVVYLMVYIIYS